MTSVTVLAGERTIGGLQVLVEDRGHRLLFDCGLAYEPATNPFAYVQSRPDRLLADLLHLGQAPYLPGLYRPDALEGFGAEERDSGPLAVALSHSHLDHSHLVGFVRPDVPIYASPPAARLVQTMSDVGDTLAPVTRPITPVGPEEAVEVGPMRLRILPVEHDVGGASGLLIETSEGVIAYSGDFRLHGADPMRTLSFAQTARAAGTRLLVMEGTRLWPPPDPDTAGPPPALYERIEQDVVPDALRALQAAPDRLGLILLSPGNGERVEALARGVAEEGRLLVLDRDGLALTVAALGRPIEPPHGMYVPTHGSEDEAPPAILGSMPNAPNHRVTAREIAADPGSYLLHLPFPAFADLVDLLPGREGGVLITSNGAPLGRFDPAWRHMEWWADQFNLEIADASCSGHASPRDLALFAAQTGAPTVMSVHSRHPELMPVAPEKLLLPERGVAYDLNSLAKGRAGL